VVSVQVEDGSLKMEVAIFVIPSKFVIPTQEESQQTEATNVSVDIELSVICHCFASSLSLVSDKGGISTS
jgi:hypothetical protein